MSIIRKTIYKCLLLAYALISSILLGALVGFLIIYPFLQILLDHLGHDKTAWVHYSVYFMVILSIGVFTFINIKRYARQVRKKNLI